MKVLLVLAHHRRQSVTGQVCDLFAAALARNGHATEIADLAAEGFDPVLREDDEPDWDNPRKRYSDAVQREMERIERNEATILFFPVYWWSMPALAKGWIDRVWNNGWAYGDRFYPHRKAWMVAIAGSDAAGFAKRGYDAAMVTQLHTGILDYCHIKETRLELLHSTLEGPEGIAKLFAAAQALAAEF
ncbi:NAD(P)H-dependent oxidoreductase [soil metagenome]